LTSVEVVERLDGLHAFFERADVGNEGLSRLAQAFVEATSRQSFRGLQDDAVERVVAEEVDELVSDSHVLAQLRKVAPWLDEGPTSITCEQHWTFTSKPPWVTPRAAHPHLADFVAVKTLRNAHEIAARPFPGGLNTSSATAAWPGMWRAFLERNASDTMWPKPWITWRMEAMKDVRVLHIDSACAWRDLVTSHPLRWTASPFVHPNWPAIACDFDAVHLAPAAVFATEGLAIESRLGLIRPTYWDVECTVWLNWRFRAVTRLHTET
jgi:hypothetical protein